MAGLTEDEKRVFKALFKACDDAITAILVRLEAQTPGAVKALKMTIAESSDLRLVFDISSRSVELQLIDSEGRIEQILRNFSRDNLTD